jgi:hypothetical protein
VRYCYDLQATEDVNAALADLRGFWKFWSACLLVVCGVPTLHGLVVTSRYFTVQEEIRRLLVEQNSPVVLLRHDKKREFPAHPRGGFILKEALLPETIDFFLDLGRIVLVFEEADPLLNGYNLNFLFESDSEIWVEIVGPGFDASDLQRGDASPHEAFSVRLGGDGLISELKLAYQVDRQSYERSVQARKAKIKAKLESSPSPELAQRIREDLGIPDDLEAHLDAIGSPLMSARSYKPISEDIVRDTVVMLRRSNVLKRYHQETGTEFPLVISSSFVNKGRRQVFWDIVSPSLKFEGMPTAGV